MKPHLCTPMHDYASAIKQLLLLLPVTTIAPMLIASHMGPIMKPLMKMRVPTWLSGAAVTATTMYSSTATHEPGKRSTLQGQRYKTHRCG
jgi:hypothetical protein